VQEIVDAQKEEIKSRIDRFRDGKPLPAIKNRIVIIVDDGIATGSTIVPAIKLCKAQEAAKVVVAAPVSGERYVSEINDLADEIVIPLQPAEFYAVGQVYEDFHHLSDDEVQHLLRDYDHERVSSIHHGKNR
jgi:putative phosphoribosyl transferase